MAMHVSSSRETRRGMVQDLSQEPGPINTLLPELTKLVFNQLDNESRQIASCASRSWTQIVLEGEREKFQADLQTFVQTILPFLKKWPGFDEYEEKIQDILNGKHYLPAQSVPQQRKAQGLRLCSLVHILRKLGFKFTLNTMTTDALIKLIDSPTVIDRLAILKIVKAFNGYGHPGLPGEDFLTWMRREKIVPEEWWPIGDFRSERTMRERAFCSSDEKIDRAFLFAGAPAKLMEEARANAEREPALKIAAKKCAEGGYFDQAVEACLEISLENRLEALEEVAEAAGNIDDTAKMVDFLNKISAETLPLEPRWIERMQDKSIKHRASELDMSKFREVDECEKLLEIEDLQLRKKAIEIFSSKIKFRIHHQGGMNRVDEFKQLNRLDELRFGLRRITPWPRLKNRFIRALKITIEAIKYIFRLAVYVICWRYISSRYNSVFLRAINKN